MSKEEYNKAISMLRSDSFYLVGLQLLAKHVSLEHICSLIINSKVITASCEITFGDYYISTMLEWRNKRDLLNPLWIEYIICITYHLKDPTKLRGWIRTNHSEQIQTNKNSAYRQVIADKLIRKHLLELLKTLI